MTEPTETHLHDGGRGGSRLDLPDTGSGTPSKQTSRGGTPGANAGNSTRNASRQ